MANPIDLLKPILIAGPTASGKSALAMHLAETLGGIVINADALQVYSAWRILSARPSEDDEARVPHALYGHVAPERAYSVGDWLKDVALYLSAPKRPIIVGGTGLYFAALTEGLAVIPPIPDGVRDEGNRLREVGGNGLLEALAERDPEIVAAIDTKNPARVQRAWEVIEATGESLLTWQSRTGPPLVSLGETVAFRLDADRDWLANRIATRFATMLEDGAEAEVAAWEAAGYDSALPAAKALGRQEIAAYLAGNITRDDAVAQAAQATRRYAKRQRTWARARMGEWNALTVGPGTTKASLNDAALTILAQDQSHSL